MAKTRTKTSTKTFYVHQHHLGESRVIPLTKAVPATWELLKVEVLETGEDYVILKIINKG
jgi:hypothetical protein